MMSRYFGWRQPELERPVRHRAMQVRTVGRSQQGEQRCPSFMGPLPKGPFRRHWYGMPTDDPDDADRQRQARSSANDQRLNRAESVPTVCRARSSSGLGAGILR